MKPFHAASLVLPLLVCALPAGCAAAYDFRPYLESPPRSIVVMPVVARSGTGTILQLFRPGPDRPASKDGKKAGVKDDKKGAPAPAVRPAPPAESARSTAGLLVKHLAENGYYVFPPALVESTLREAGVSRTAGPKDVRVLKSVGELFGADAALFVVVDEAGTKTDPAGVESKVGVELTLVDVKSGRELWRRRAEHVERDDLPTVLGTLAWIPVGGVIGFGKGVEVTAQGLGPPPSGGGYVGAFVAAVYGAVIGVGGTVGFVAGMVAGPADYRKKTNDAHAAHLRNAAAMQAWLLHNGVADTLRRDRNALPLGPRHPDHAEQLNDLRERFASPPTAAP